MALNEKQLKLAEILGNRAFSTGCRTKEAVRNNISVLFDPVDPYFDELVEAAIKHIEARHQTIVPSEKDSPAFSDFRSLMDKWDKVLEGDEEQEDELSFFFRVDGQKFGAPEDARIIYASMKNPDEDMDKKWLKDADFVGTNVETKQQRIFGKKDLKNIVVISKEEAMKKEQP